jgi:alcohol dehydrogenase
MSTMRAAIFVEPGRIVLEDKPIPHVGLRDALVRVTAIMIYGTDVNILKGKYTARKGLTIGHEPVGAIENWAKLSLAMQKGNVANFQMGGLIARSVEQCRMGNHG